MFSLWSFLWNGVFNGCIIFPCMALYQTHLTLPFVGSFAWSIWLQWPSVPKSMESGSLLFQGPEHPALATGSRRGEFLSSQSQPLPGQRWVLSGIETWVQRRQPPVGLLPVPCFFLGSGFIFLIVSTGTLGQFAGDGRTALHMAGRKISMALT